MYSKEHNNKKRPRMHKRSAALGANEGPQLAPNRLWPDVLHLLGDGNLLNADIGPNGIFYL
jgi:hypothetical protein